MSLISSRFLQVNLFSAVLTSNWLNAKWGINLRIRSEISNNKIKDVQKCFLTSGRLSELNFSVKYISPLPFDEFCVASSTWQMNPVEVHCRTQRLNFLFFLFLSSLSVQVVMNTGSSSISGSWRTCKAHRAALLLHVSSVFEGFLCNHVTSTKCVTGRSSWP